jgi:signal peptidase II
LAVIAAVVVIVDRITKIYVERHFGVPYGPRQVVDHVLYLTVTRNAGAAFGLFQNFTLGFLLISAVVMVAILIYYGRLPAGDWPARLGLALVFGGAISNA